MAIYTVILFQKRELKQWEVYFLDNRVCDAKIMQRHA